MGEKDDKEKNKSKSKNKKQKHQHPNDQTTKPTPSTSNSSDKHHKASSFKPSKDVKGIRFGGQFIIKSFTIRRAAQPELIALLSLPKQPSPPPPLKPSSNIETKTTKIPFPSTIAFIPTNFTILAHHAWHTLTLGLGTKKSKVVLFVFESESMKTSITRTWPQEIPLGEVNKKMIRKLNGCELARFKFKKGCITFYVYAVRQIGCNGFSCSDDLRIILQSVVDLKDFLDHTVMLSLPNQRSISSYPPSSLTMAH